MKSKEYLTRPQGNRNTKIKHCFFVNNVNLNAKNMHEMNKSLDLETTFSRDVGLNFGQDKCFYMVMKRGNL